MKVQVEVDKKRTNLRLRVGSTAQEVFSRLSLPPDAFIILRKNKPIPLNEELHEGDVLRLLRVASGG